MKPLGHWAALPMHVFIIENVDKIKWGVELRYDPLLRRLAPRQRAFIDGKDITDALNTLVSRRKWLAYPKGIFRWRRHEAKPWVTKLGHHAREEFINKQMRDGHVGNT